MNAASETFRALTTYFSFETFSGFERFLIILYKYRESGFRSPSRPEPGYLAGAGAVTLAQFTQITWNLTFDAFSKVNINYDLYVMVHVLERILDNS